MLSKNTIFVIISYGWILFKDNKVDTRIPRKGCIHTTSTLTEINIIFKPNKCSELAWNHTMDLRTPQELSLGNLLSIRYFILIRVLPLVLLYHRIYSSKLPWPWPQSPDLTAIQISTHLHQQPELLTPVAVVQGCIYTQVQYI